MGQNDCHTMRLSRRCCNHPYFDVVVPFLCGMYVRFDLPVHLGNGLDTGLSYCTFLWRTVYTRVLATYIAVVRYVM